MNSIHAKFPSFLALLSLHVPQHNILFWQRFLHLKNKTKFAYKKNRHNSTNKNNRLKQ